MQNHKEKPILFNSEMVKAVLSGRKTQTRRVIKPQPINENNQIYSSGLIGPELYEPVIYNKQGEMVAGEEIFGVYTDDGDWGWKCPYGQVGDRLWVRETLLWESYASNDITDLAYKADDSEVDGEMPRDWIPPQNNIESHFESGGNIPDGGFYYHTGQVNSIFMPRWASRINLEITDIRVERVRDINPLSSLAEGCKWEKGNGPSVNFKKLWNSIYEKRGYGWGVNPWVWVVEFKVI